jgi:hypothetical protein
MYTPEFYGRNCHFVRPGLLRRSRSRQAGITALGFLILAGVYKEFDSQNPSRSAILTSVRRRFDVESVSVITARDIKVINDSGGFKVAAVYDHSTPFIGNISFTVHFDRDVLVRR